MFHKFDLCKLGAREATKQQTWHCFPSSPGKSICLAQWRW